MSRYTLDHLRDLPGHAPVGEVAAALDLDVPGWEHKVNVETLDMHNPCRCIAGQVASSWREDGTNGYGKLMTRLGFKYLDAFDGNQRLRYHWIRAIQKRLAA